MKHIKRSFAPFILLALLLTGLSSCSLFQMLGFMPPDSPGGLTVNNPTASSLDISWSTTTGATSYSVFHSTSASGPWGDPVYNSSATKFTDSKLSAMTTYYYVVQAKNSAGTSALSTAVSGTTSAGSTAPAAPVISGTLEPPGVPTDLSIDTETLTNSSMDLSWTAEAGQTTAIVTWALVSGATSYDLYWTQGSTVTIATGTKIAGASSPQSIPNLAYGSQYAFIVVSVNSIGESSASNVATMSPTINYQLYRDESDTITTGSPLAYDGPETYFTDSGLVSNWTYYYSIRATNSGGSSALFTPAVSESTQPILGSRVSGYNSEYSGSTTLSPNIMYAFQINTLGDSTDEVEGFGVDSFSSGPKIRMALYSDSVDSPGTPGTLLDETAPTVMVNAGSSANIEMASTMGASTSNDYLEYWIVVIVDSTASVGYVGEGLVLFTSQNLDFSASFPAVFPDSTPTSTIPYGIYLRGYRPPS